MQTFDFTFQWRKKTATVRASGANQTCAHVEALGEIWERWGDRAIDSDGAKVTKVVPVVES